MLLEALETARDLGRLNEIDNRPAVAAGVEQAAGIEP